MGRSRGSASLAAELVCRLSVQRTWSHLYIRTPPRSTIATPALRLTSSTVTVLNPSRPGTKSGSGTEERSSLRFPEALFRCSCRSKRRPRASSRPGRASGRCGSGLAGQECLLSLKTTGRGWRPVARSARVRRRGSRPCASCGVRSKGARSEAKRRLGRVLRPRGEGTRGRKVPWLLGLPRAGLARPKERGVHFLGGSVRPTRMVDPVRRPRRAHHPEGEVKLEIDIRLSSARLASFTSLESRPPSKGAKGEGTK